MTEDEFRARVERLEVIARESPGRYRFSVIAWTVFGSLLAWSVPLLLLLLCGGVIVLAFFVGSGLFILLKVLKIGVLPMLLLAGGLLKLLAGRLEPPEGLRIERESYPELFAMIDRVANKAGVTPPREVRLTDDFNASVAELPRVPLLPLYRTYLQIGVPLLASLTLEEVEAVLAHELGHLSGAHGRLSARIYRVRRVWGELAEQMQGPAGWFLAWYAPRYSAQTFVMARQHEYYADAVSASVTSPRIAGDALVRSSIESVVQANEFWPPIFQRAQHEREPPSGVIVALLENAPKLGDPAQRDTALRAELAEESDVRDTHPALAQRLEALGVEPRVPPPIEQSAARVLLGARFQFVGEFMGSKWRSDVGNEWTNQFRESRKLDARMTKLDAKGDARTAREELELGALAERLGRTGTALMAFQRAIEKDPQLAVAHLRLGSMLLEEGESEGVRLLDHARQLDPELELEATDELYRYHLAAKDEAAAARERERFDRAYAEHQKIAAERSELGPNDAVAPAALDPSVREALAKALLLSGVRAAWIARKVTRYGNRAPVHVIVVDPEAWGSEPEMVELNAESSFTKACEAIDLDGPWIAYSARDRPEIRQSVAAVAGSQLV